MSEPLSSKTGVFLPRYSAFGRELEATEPDAKAYFTKYDVARDEIERLRAALDLAQTRFKEIERMVTRPAVETKDGQA